ncbi:hypothetical protein B0H17DRAFT_1029618, partial [Mycena rosella]
MHLSQMFSQQATTHDVPPPPSTPRLAFIHKLKQFDEARPFRLVPGRYTTVATVHEMLAEHNLFESL